jgi:hypothetical protein
MEKGKEKIKNKIRPREEEVEGHPARRPSTSVMNEIKMRRGVISPTVF